MPKISIIIPVYNVENYLSQCLESIIIQRFNDYEIILVNDGSIDNSGLICNQYSEKYDFIHVIHKENGGASDARNVGIQNTKGQYILFIDADDYIYKESLSDINHALNLNPDVDIIFLEADKLFEDGRMVPLGEGFEKARICNKTQEEVMAHLSELPKFPGGPWAKLIKRNLIVDNNIYFEKGIVAEDIDWVVQLLLSAEKFDYCEQKYYVYRQNRPGSVTSTTNIKYINSLIYIIKKWSKESDKDCSEKNKYQKYINAFMAYEYVMTLALYGRLTEEDRNKVKTDVYAYSWLLFRSQNWKVKIIKTVYLILGLKAASRLLAVYSKHRT